MPRGDALTGRPAASDAHASSRDELTRLLCEQLHDQEDSSEIRRLTSEIVTLSLPLADALAARYVGRGAEYDDLVQVARTALLLTVRRFRPDEARSFAAFAVPTITGELKRYFRDHCWVIRPPRQVQEMRWLLSKERRRLEQETGTTVTVDQLGAELDLDPQRAEESITAGAGYRPMSLDEDAARWEGERHTVWQTADDDPVESLAQRLDLRKALSALSPQDRLVLRWRFQDECTQDEIATRLGVSQMQVSRILRRLLGTTRDLLSERPTYDGGDRVETPVGSPTRPTRHAEESPDDLHSSGPTSLRRAGEARMSESGGRGGSGPPTPFGAHGTETPWRSTILQSLHVPMVVLDAGGLVLQLNQAFTDLFGYSMADGPIRPPYPWWPTESEDAEARTVLKRLVGDVRARRAVEADVVLYTNDRRPVWVHSTGNSVNWPTGRAFVRVLRDVTRERQAQERRSAAVQVSADFARISDLADLLEIAAHGFDLLFDGTTTIRLDVGQRYVFGSERRIPIDRLDERVTTGLAGSPSPDTTSLRPGILLVPQTTTTPARAWVQFPRLRRIHTDEMIAADLLAQAFGLAIDRVVTLQRAADRQANLELAVESHQLVGQAVGILVERHRLRPNDAFERLRHVSQTRNVKLREIALRVLETGADPEDV
jgi:RNA polymerase sigma factor (sigma-70 family)